MKKNLIVDCFAGGGGRMKETKYDKNNFPDALLKEWDKTRKQILGKEGKENGDHRNCSVLRGDSRVSKTNA